VRPDVTGRRLRAVAVAGPLAGVGVGVLATALIQAQPVCGLAGMIVVALHLANLTPRAPDGRACWTGQP
jgi:hypothetical protein